MISFGSVVTTLIRANSLKGEDAKLKGLTGNLCQPVANGSNLLVIPFDFHLASIFFTKGDVYEIAGM